MTGTTRCSCPAKRSVFGEVTRRREFWECVDKLRACQHRPIHSTYLILVYQQFQPSASQKTFEENYGGLSVGERIADVVTFEREQLVCKLLEIRPSAPVLP